MRRVHLDIINLERLRVSQRRSESTILSTGRAHQELEFIKSKLNPDTELRLRSHRSTQVEAVPNSKNRLQLQILTPM